MAEAEDQPHISEGDWIEGGRSGRRLRAGRATERQHQQESNAMHRTPPGERFGSGGRDGTHGGEARQHFGSRVEGMHREHEDVAGL